MPDAISPEALKLLAYCAEEGGCSYHPLINENIVNSLLEQGLITTEIRAETLTFPVSTSVSDLPFVTSVSLDIVSLFSSLFILASSAGPLPVNYALITPVGEKYLAQHKHELESRIY